jgi:hypothetical protein
MARKIIMTFTPKMSKQEMMDHLLRETIALFKSPEGQRIIAALNKIAADIRSAFILSHIPEQGEDIYRILLNGDKIVGFELQRNDNDSYPLEVINFSVDEYRKIVKGRRNNEKLANAIALAKSNINLFVASK